jgi:hypothetical protein
MVNEASFTENKKQMLKLTSYDLFDNKKILLKTQNESYLKKRAGEFPPQIYFLSCGFEI